MMSMYQSFRYPNGVYRVTHVCMCVTCTRIIITRCYSHREIPSFFLLFINFAFLPIPTAPPFPQIKVLELKTKLQRVRTSNERRAAKLFQRWSERASAAAVEREAVADRQRSFVRQLENDVEGMEEKLGALERQVRRYCTVGPPAREEGRAAPCFCVPMQLLLCSC